MQIYTAEKLSGQSVSGVVLMGIGEPLDNYDNVLRFLKILSDENGRGLSLRHVSLSTCGIVPRIRELGAEKLGITLSVSLHSAINEKRSTIMPVNSVYDVFSLIKACDEYMSATGRRISYEYSVIDGVNNNYEDANALIKLLRGKNCHVNLIPVNSVAETSFRSGRKSAVQFKELLIKGGLNVTVRRTLGSDINAACGQLRSTIKNSAITHEN
jgi:23S rRNA (adenine2503-C2)-methyltransferase